MTAPDIPGIVEPMWTVHLIDRDSSQTRMPAKARTAGGGFPLGDSIQLSLNIPKTERSPSKSASSAVQMNVMVPFERKLDATESIGSSSAEATQRRVGNGKRSSSQGKKSLTRKKLLEDHKLGLYADGKENQYKCAVCEKVFKQIFFLNCHMRIHTGEKPYSCTVCGAKFSQRQHLNRLVMDHTGEKPYLCTICGSKFKQQCALNSHMRIHTGEKPYCCSVCGLKFTWLSGLKKHQKKQH